MGLRVTICIPGVYLNFCRVQRILLLNNSIQYQKKSTIVNNIQRKREKILSIYLHSNCYQRNVISVNHVGHFIFGGRNLPVLFQFLRGGKTEEKEEGEEEKEEERGILLRQFKIKIQIRKVVYIFYILFHRYAIQLDIIPRV